MTVTLRMFLWSNLHLRSSKLNIFLKMYKKVHLLLPLPVTILIAPFPTGNLWWKIGCKDTRLGYHTLRILGNNVAYVVRFVTEVILISIGDFPFSDPVICNVCMC